MPPVAISHAGVPPVAMRTVIFSKSLLPLQCPVTLPSKMESENMGTMHVLTAVAHRPARYRRLVRRTYSLFTLRYSLKTPGIDAASKGSLAKGSWYHRHLRDSQLAIPERMGLCGNLQACGIPPVLPEAKPPPFGKGGFEVHTHCHRSNDTGRVREVTKSRKPPCEIVCGDPPPGTARRN